MCFRNVYVRKAPVHIFTVLEELLVSKHPRASPSVKCTSTPKTASFKMNIFINELVSFFSFPPSGHIFKYS